MQDLLWGDPGVRNADGGGYQNYSRNSFRIFLGRKKEKKDGQPEHLNAYNTYQVKNYDRYELASFSEEAKRQYRDEHREQDLQRAFDAGRRMAESILK